MRSWQCSGNGWKTTRTGDISTRWATVKEKHWNKEGFALEDRCWFQTYIGFFGDEMLSVELSIYSQKRWETFIFRYSQFLSSVTHLYNAVPIWSEGYFFIFLFFFAATVSRCPFNAPHAKSCYVDTATRYSHWICLCDCACSKHGCTDCVLQFAPNYMNDWLKSSVTGNNKSIKLTQKN